MPEVSSLRPYPTQIPQESWQVISGLVGGTLPPTERLIHIVEDSAAFCLGKVFPDGPIVVGANPPAAVSGGENSMSAEEAIDKLASGSIQASSEVPGVSGAIPIPWKLILTKLIKLLLDQVV